MIISIEGQEATGKTTLAYTAPYPIVGISFDLGDRRAIYGTKYPEYFAGMEVAIIEHSRELAEEAYKKATGNDITIFQLRMPVQMETGKLSGCIELWDKFIGLLVKAIEDSTISTVVVDTMTLARKLKADAHLQEAQKRDVGRQQLIQIEYGPVNDAIRNIYNYAQSTGKNLVATHHLQDEYKNVPGIGGRTESMPTGNMVLEGYNKTLQAVDLGVRMEKRKGELFGKLLKVGDNLSLEGQELANPNWNSIVTMIEMSLGERIKLPHRKER